MTIHPWQAAITRWGDPVFRLALLLTDTYAAAEQATVTAFTRTLSGEHTDLETALYQQLFAPSRQRRRRLPGQRLLRTLQQRASVRLPRPISRLAPHDRGLLGLWLLRDVDGARLLTISGMSAAALVEHMAGLLIQLLPSAALSPAAATAADDQSGPEALESWLRRKLGLELSSPVHLASDAQHAAEVRWQAGLDELRLHLRDALEPQRLPQPCSEAIQAALLTLQAGGPPRWWERPSVWAAGVVVGALLGLAWLILPGASPSAGTAGQPPLAPQSAHEIVQQALDLWSTQPVSSTLQRTVWALPPTPLPATQPARQRLRRDQPQITNVWLEAGSARYRVEVRSGERLIEWQLGDGSAKLEYAALNGSSSCAWGDSGTSESVARTFAASAEEQRATLTARLTLGAYGQGYHALHEALSASDLRSFGTRKEGQDLLLALRFTSHSGPTERKLLLWVDTATRELRAVQELPPSGEAGAARDLWRLQQRQQLPFGIPRARPAWSQPFQDVDHLLDPSCPALDEQQVVSPRLMIGYGWPLNQYLPQPLPASVTRVVLLGSTPDPRSSSQLDRRAILLGPEQWLRIRYNERGMSDGTPVQRGAWLVSLEQDNSVLEARLCPQQQPKCFPALEVDARGWSQEQLLTLIDSLQPLNMQSWSTLDERFLDPAPLQPSVRNLLLRAIEAVQLQLGSTRLSVAEITTRVDPNDMARRDPYQVPLEVLNPARQIEQSWQEASATTAGRYSVLRTLPDGTPLSAEINDGQRYTSFERRNGSATIQQVSENLSLSHPHSPADRMLLSMLSQPEPIALTVRPDALVLEQVLAEPPDERRIFELQLYHMWLDDLSDGSLRQRITLDPATARPQQFQLLHRASDGQETVLSALTLRQWSDRSEPAPDAAFQLPPLPDDVVVIDRTSGHSQIVGGKLAIQPQGRALIWPASSFEPIEPLAPGRQLADAFDDSTQPLDALSFGLDGLEYSGLIQTATYRLPDSPTPLITRQGPRDLLRYWLRYRGSYDLEWMESSSTPFELPIAGQPRTAWLLDVLPTPLLVVEAEETMLLISGPSREVLEGEVVPRLPELEWTALDAQP